MPKEKFNRDDLRYAVTRLAMLKFWTADLAGPVQHLLQQICPHKEALEWLVAELVNRVNEWPGPGEVRGILCSRYDAADGIDGWSSLPGYSAADGEARSLAEHDTYKTQERIGGSVGETDDLMRQIRQAAGSKLLN